MKKKGLISTLFVALMLASMLSVLPLGASTTTLRFYFVGIGYDELIATTPGGVGDIDTSFTVHIIVEDVQALACWAFAMSWDPAILECIDDGYGTTSALDGDPWFLPMPYTVNNTAGTLGKPGAVAPDPLVGVDGTVYPDCPLLFLATFRVIGYGATGLNWDPEWTSLLDPSGAEIMPRDEIDGFFDNTALKPPPVTTLSMDAPKPPPYIFPGDTFTVNWTITDVTDLFTWSIAMKWDASILNCTGVTEGPFLKSVGTTLWMDGVIDNVIGEMTKPYGCSLTTVPGATGSGVLATATFLATANGTSFLNFTTVSLLDSTLEEIECEVVDDEVVVEPPLPVQTMVFFNINPNPATVGETVTLKGILVDEFSQPLSNENVKLYARPLAGSWIYITSLTTNGYGIFMWETTIPVAGTFIFAVYYTGSVWYESTYNLAILIVQ